MCDYKKWLTTIMKSKLISIETRVRMLQTIIREKDENDAKIRDCLKRNPGCSREKAESFFKSQHMGHLQIQFSSMQEDEAILNLLVSELTYLKDLASATALSATSKGKPLRETFCERKRRDMTDKIICKIQLQALHLRNFIRKSDKAEQYSVEQVCQYVNLMCRNISRVMKHCFTDAEREGLVCDFHFLDASSSGGIDTTLGEAPDSVSNPLLSLVQTSSAAVDRVVTVAVGYMKPPVPVFAVGAVGPVETVATLPAVDPVPPVQAGQTLPAVAPVPPVQAGATLPAVEPVEVTERMNIGEGCDLFVDFTVQPGPLAVQDTQMEELEDPFAFLRATPCYYGETLEDVLGIA